MPRIVTVTPHLAIAGALGPQEVAEAAALGFKSIVSNLPDGELAAYPHSGEEARLAAAAGLGFRHIPVRKADVFSSHVVDGMAEALAALEAPVLVHCASGIRSALAWAAAAARVQPADQVLEALQAAGIDLTPVRDDLVDLHDPGRAGPIPPALRIPQRG